MTVMEQVPGNCDGRQEVQERILLIEGKKILICHGHTFNVKAGYLNLEYAAEGGRSMPRCSGMPTGVFYDKHNRIHIGDPVVFVIKNPVGMPKQRGIDLPLLCRISPDSDIRLLH